MPSCASPFGPGDSNVRRAADRPIIIQVQHPFGGGSLEQLAPFWNAYEESQQETGVEALWVLNDLNSNESLFAAVAAGEPPDATWVDGQQVAEWAENGVFEPLTDFVQADNIREEDYWVPCWRQNAYGGHIWALTHTADANFGFFWNKDLFADAGLDPEQPPANVDEVRAMNKVLTRTADEAMAQVGIIPWSTYGFANAMFTWGWLFGGRFFDYETNKVTADHERNVLALAWMQSIGQDNGGFEKVVGFEQSFSGDTGHLFFQNVLGMAFLGPWEMANIERVAPDLSYGITYAPLGPPPAEPRSSWVGGWSVAMPKGASQSDAAWDFIKWVCATDEGTSLYGRMFNQTPGYRKSSWYQTLESEQPRMIPFVDILREAKHQRPVMPAQASYMGAIHNYVEESMLGYLTPQQALRSAATETQAILDEMLDS